MKTSLVLMILFIVLGTFALFDPFHFKEKKELEQETAIKFWVLSGKKIESIRIKNGKSEIAMQCAMADGCAFDVNSDWKISSPVEDLGDAATIGNFTSSLLNLNTVEKLDFDTSPDLKEFGLDQPEMQLEVKMKGENEPYMADFGKAAALGPTVYAKSNRKPNQISLVANYFTNTLKKDLFYWRNKRFFPQTTAEKITFIEWKSPTGLVRAEKDEGDWRLVKPIEADANDIMIEGLVSTLAYSAAKTAVEKESTGKNIFTLSFGHKEKKYDLSLFERKADKDFLAKTSENKHLYTIESTQFDRFKKSLAEYRQNTAIGNEWKKRFEQIRFIFPKEKKSVTLKHKGVQWVYDSGDKLEEISQSRVASFIEALTSKEGKFTTGPEYLLFGRLPSDLEVELYSESKVLFKTRFAIAKRRFALTKGQLPNEVLILADDFVKTMPVRLADLLEANNKQVVIHEERKGQEDGHNHSH